MNSRATQQFNVSPYIYAIYWLPPGSSAFLLARKCNWLAGIMVMRCVMRHAWTQKLLLSGPTVYSLYCVLSYSVSATVRVLRKNVNDQKTNVQNTKTSLIAKKNYFPKTSIQIKYAVKYVGLTVKNTKYFNIDGNLTHAVITAAQRHTLCTSSLWSEFLSACIHHPGQKSELWKWKAIMMAFWYEYCSQLICCWIYRRA